MPEFEQLIFTAGMSTVVLCDVILARSIINSKKIKRHKIDDIKSVEEIYRPPILDKNDYDFKFSRVLIGRFKDQVTKFRDTLEENFPPEVLGNFYKNIGTAKILIMPLKTSSGGYRIKFNTITIDKKYLDSNTIYHELFHLASSNRRILGDLSGFYYSNLDKSIELGKGINEGYTELLACTYFKDYGITYKFQTMVASKLNELVGKETMERLYFTTDLRGLMEELQKYVDFEDIKGFITDLDFFTAVNGKEIKPQGKNPDEIDQMLIEKMDNVKKFLAKVYISKNAYSNLSEEEREDDMNRFAKSMEIDVRLPNSYYIGDDMTNQNFQDKYAEVRSEGNTWGW